MSSQYVVVGLGNPGREYASTRHNVGFAVTSRLVERLRADGPRLEHRCLVYRARVDDTALLVAQPQTFMNLSGQAVRSLLTYYKVEPSMLVAVYDDMDLAFGRIRIRATGSAGGHNGVKSLIEHLGTQDFIRVRVGIGRPTHGDPVTYVLGRWTSQEMEELPAVVDRAADAILSVITEGLVPAMNRYNR